MPGGLFAGGARRHNRNKNNVFADLGGVAGPAMAVLSATLFGLAALPAKRGLNYVSAEVGALVTIVTTWVICLLLSPFWMRSSDWFTPGFWVFVLAGLIHPYLSMYSSFEALRRAGTTVASTLAATSPFFSTLGALIFLDEELSLIVALATVGIVAGIVVLTFDGGRVARMMRVALIFATAAAVIRAGSHVIGKWGLEMLPNPFMATFISFSMGIVGMTVFFRVRHGHFPESVSKEGIKCFIYSGLFVAFAIISMYAALMLGRVVVISPIIASYPAFTLLAVLLLRTERITRRIVIGVVMVTIGVIVIALGDPG